MDAVVDTVTWQYQAFLRTGNGDVWRMWFDGDEPVLQKLFGGEAEFAEPLAKLRERFSATSRNLQHYTGN